jgi:hypothetical protein
MTNSITEFTKQRPKEPGQYFMKEDGVIFYVVLQESGKRIMAIDGSAGAVSAFNWPIGNDVQYARIELSE